MYYVALDIHQRSTSVKILDCNGKFVKRVEWKLPLPQLADPSKVDGASPSGACFEAFCSYGCLYQEFSKVAHTVKAAYPGSRRLNYRSKTKGNRVYAGAVLASTFNICVV